jgi:hypothetical protein
MELDLVLTILEEVVVGNLFAADDPRRRTEG